MIRLSTSWMYQQSLTTMLDQQGSLAATQNQVSSGQRINLASDDPAGATQAVSLNHILASTAQYSANIDGANARLSTESSTLSSFNSLLDQARSMALQGINGTLSTADRQDMATQLTQIRAQLVQLANTTDASGNGSVGQLHQLCADLGELGGHVLADGGRQRAVDALQRHRARLVEQRVERAQRA